MINSENVYAAIDFGSNSVNLVVYDMTDERMILMYKQKAMLGIIGYIQEGKINKEGIRNAVALLADMRRKAMSFDARIYCFATAALRGVINAHEVTDTIFRETAMIVDVVSWEREAYYDFLALTKLMKMENTLAVDIGGGSIEIILSQNGILTQSASIPTGSLKLFQDYVHGVFPNAVEVLQIESIVNAYLDNVEWLGLNSCETLYTIGGTARGIVKLHKHIFSRSFNRAAYTYPFEDLHRLAKILANENESSKIITNIVPDRIKTIIPGFLILQLIAKRSGVRHLILSKFGVREGYLIDKVWEQDK